MSAGNKTRPWLLLTLVPEMLSSRKKKTSLSYPSIWKIVKMIYCGELVSYLHAAASKMSNTLFFRGIYVGLSWKHFICVFIIEWIFIMRTTRMANTYAIYNCFSDTIGRYAFGSSEIKDEAYDVGYFSASQHYNAYHSLRWSGAYSGL